MSSPRCHVRHRDPRHLIKRTLSLHSTPHFDPLDDASGIALARIPHNQRELDPNPTHLQGGVPCQNRTTSGSLAKPSTPGTRTTPNTACR